MKTPKSLCKGDRVALIAPSGSLPEGMLHRAISEVQSFGLEPVVFSSCTLSPGRFSVYNRERAADLNNAFADRSIDGILCVGNGFGYGAQHLLDRIRWDMIAKTPKMFFGYGDTAILHMVLNQKCDLVTYYTPVMQPSERTDPYTERSLKEILFGVRNPEIRNPEGMPLKTMAKGICHGILTGGSLSAAAASLGTPYEIDTKDKILLLEDDRKTPQQIDRMLLMLKQAGKLRSCAGILLGAFTHCEQDRSPEKMKLREVFSDLLLDEGKPILGALQCGNVLPGMALPLGVNLSMDATNCELRVLEY